MLLRECLLDDTLSYQCTLSSSLMRPVLFGLLKENAGRQLNFKLVVTSATLDAEKFSGYFSNCLFLPP